MRRARRRLALIAALGLAAPAMADGEASVERGAQVYVERCVLCHDSKGMGEGFLPLKIKDYPVTNLRSSQETDLAVLERAVRTGTASGEPSPLSPPWADELDDVSIRSVALFVRELRTDLPTALARIESLEALAPEVDGADIFATRCAICHGPKGEGNGKMAKVIKSPPPFNLTLSVMPRAYLAEIIGKGGEAMMRSPKMPPWGEELGPREIDAVIDHILTFRKLGAAR